MNREEAKKVLNAIDFKDGDNIVIINKNVYDKMKKEKQQLISFLENKIKNSEDNKRNFPNEFSFWIGKLGAYQEVLDFVNKGDKDE